MLKIICQSSPPLQGILPTIDIDFCESQGPEGPLFKLPDEWGHEKCESGLGVCVDSCGRGTVES